MEGVSRRDTGLSDDDSTGFVEQEETSSLVDKIEWTDEKHSLYLKSMEASFVDQLYNLKDLFSWCPSSQHGIDEKLCRQGSPSGSGQFKVQQHCHRAKKFRKTAPQPEVVDGSGKVLANPWSKSLTSSYGNISGLFTDGKHHQVSINLNEECSAQNFINKDCASKAPRGRREKRLRTPDTSDEINNDQVVPFGRSCLPMPDRNEGCSGAQDRTIEQSGKAMKTENAF